MTRREAELEIKDAAVRREIARIDEFNARKGERLAAEDAHRDRRAEYKDGGLRREGPAFIRRGSYLNYAEEFEGVEGAR